jgi:hypothetical protein
VLVGRDVGIRILVQERQFFSTCRPNRFWCLVPIFVVVVVVVVEKLFPRGMKSPELKPKDPLLLSRSEIHGWRNISGAVGLLLPLSSQILNTNLLIRLFKV